MTGTNHPVIVLDPEGDGPEQMVELIEAYWDTFRARHGREPLVYTARIWRDVLTEYGARERRARTPRCP